MALWTLLAFLSFAGVLSEEIATGLEMDDACQDQESCTLELLQHRGEKVFLDEEELEELDSLTSPCSVKAFVKVVKCSNHCSDDDVACDKKCIETSDSAECGECLDSLLTCAKKSCPEECTKFSKKCNQCSKSAGCKLIKNCVSKPKGKSS